MSRGPIDDFVMAQLLALRQGLEAHLAQLDSLLALMGVQVDPGTGEPHVVGESARETARPPECLGPPECQFPPDKGNQIALTTMSEGEAHAWMCRLCGYQEVPDSGLIEEDGHGTAGS